jgi:hypothetical protein
VFEFGCGDGGALAQPSVAAHGSGGDGDFLLPGPGTLFFGLGEFCAEFFALTWGARGTGRLKGPGGPFPLTRLFGVTVLLELKLVGVTVFSALTLLGVSGVTIVVPLGN